MQYRKYYICIIIYKIYYYISNYNKYYTTVLFLINSEVFPSIFLFYAVSPAPSATPEKTAPKQRPRPSEHSERRQIKPKPKAPATRTKKTKLKYFIYAIRLTYIFTNPPPPFLLYKSIYIYNKKPLYL